MPKLLSARAPVDGAEERQIRKLAGARQAPADGIRRAQIITASWQGLRTGAIAARLSCHPQTVRERIVRFNAEGVDGLADRPGAGRKLRITEAERSRIVALAKATPPGRLTRQADGDLDAEQEADPSQWSLDALTEAAQDEGIVVGRSQVRRILLTEGVRWRKPRSWTTSSDPEFAPKGTASSGSIRSRRPGPR
ncbi:helix-turn-helix domain-containing protein [Haloactinomyces albus]|uniref:Transposase n=1 Tax=Haloactinomyces albus TaxID=1352928 RepID=A0AAE3ZGI5_9ACTN|nr:helix-turn-helix domain-containing protein [Haloactinomyces albus]MDR7304503.1 transposase [Haloactinomyces albus]